MALGVDERPRRAVRGVRSGAARSRWIEWAGRAGHVAKAVSYGLIGVLALQVAFGDRAQTSDREGVLREVAGSSFGTGALIALAIGFAAYALWEFARAAFDRSHEGSRPKGLGTRAQYAVAGAVYVTSAIAAVTLARGSRSGSGGDEQAETARVLEWPGGQWIVGVVAVALLGYGLVNVGKAWTRTFRHDLREHEMDARVRRWAVRSGVVGHAARGVVFAGVGFFLAKAAIEYDPEEAVGIDGALAKLADRTFGTWLLALVAAGLVAYAVFCLVEARYRRV